MKYFYGVLAIIVLFFILSLFPEQKLPEIYKTRNVTIGNSTIMVEIADTNSLRMTGLSGREYLDEGTGMLFVFDKPDKYGFWMKDMKFPIDIVWINGGKIIHIEKSISPTTYPRVYFPVSPAQYVLELPAGFCDAQGLQVGDFFSTSPQNL